MILKKDFMKIQNDNDLLLEDTTLDKNFFFFSKFFFECLSTNFMPGNKICKK